MIPHHDGVGGRVPPGEVRALDGRSRRRASDHAAAFEHTPEGSVSLVVQIGIRQPPLASAGEPDAAGSEQRFHEGTMGGLMGNFGGQKVGRDHRTEIVDINDFAEEWQVRGDEPMLFQTVRAPQYPAKCERLTAAEARRRLGENCEMASLAKEACAHWKDEGGIERCIHDVLATGDLEMAQAGTY